MARLIPALWLLLACASAAWAQPVPGDPDAAPVQVRVQAGGAAAAEGRLLLAGGAVSSMRARVAFDLPPAAADQRWVMWLAHDPFDLVRVEGPGWTPPVVSFFKPDAALGELPAGSSFVLPRGASGPQQLDIELRGSVRSAPTVRVLSEQDVLRHAAREIALACAVYAALVTLLIATLALYAAARDRLFLLYAGYTAVALLFMATVNGHVYTIPGLRVLGTLGARGFWLVMLVFNAVALWMLLRFANTRASSHPVVRGLILLVPVLVLAAALVVLPEALLFGQLQAIATFAWVVAMLAGIVGMLDGARRGMPMALAASCALLALLIAGGAHEAMNRALLADNILTRHGYQFALVMLSVILYVGLSSRIGAVRQRLDDEANARRDSEYRLRQARARSDLGLLLQERLRGLHPEEIAQQAFRLLIQQVRSMLPGVQAAVLGQGYLEHDLLLVQGDGAPTALGQAVLAARGVVRVHAQHPQPVQAALSGARGSDASQPPTHAFVPLALAPPAWAALVLRDPGRDGFDPADLQACAELARLAVMHADQAHASIQLRRSAEYDALTGSMNRRSLDQVLMREFKHAGIASAPLSLLFIDIDWFKRVNDEHGHACGDHCLRSIASVLRAELRPTDALGRYGGEEFLVMLPGHDAPASRIIAERLRQAVERGSIDWHGHPLALTISIGLAARRNADATVADMLERADKALYAAKGEGRNRVCVAPAVFG